MKRGDQTLVVALGGLFLIFVLLAALVALFSPSGNLHFQLYDTYFVLSPWYVVIHVYLVTSFIFLLVYQIIKRFAGQMPNLLLAIGSGAMVLLSSWFVIFWKEITATWVIYPPLSYLENTKHSPVAHTWSTGYTIMLFVQAALLLLMVWCIHKRRT